MNNTGAYREGGSMAPMVGKQATGDQMLSDVQVWDDPNDKIPFN